MQEADWFNRLLECSSPVLRELGNGPACTARAMPFRNVPHTVCFHYKTGPLPQYARHGLIS